MGESPKLWTDGNGLPVGKLCKFPMVRPILGDRLESLGLSREFLNFAPPEAIHDLLTGKAVLLITALGGYKSGFIRIICLEKVRSRKQN